MPQNIRRKPNHLPYKAITYMSYIIILASFTVFHHYYYYNPSKTQKSGQDYNIDKRTVSWKIHQNQTQIQVGPCWTPNNGEESWAVNKHYNKEGKDLREELAKFAKKIATDIIDPRTLVAYTASRLIPLNKNPGDPELQVRPIEVGEVLRRIHIMDTGRENPRSRGVTSSLNGSAGRG